MVKLLNSLHEVVTVSEASVLYGCSDRYIRQLCEKGKLEARQDHKGNWLILKTSVTKEKANS